jgi:hypothetical protein
MCSMGSGCRHPMLHGIGHHHHEFHRIPEDEAQRGRAMEDGVPAGALFFERTGVEGSVVNHGLRGVVEDAGWGACR